nr:multiple coagulation factor deficiency protein 2 homolog [Parasteatoda tepidariorum]
MELLLILSLALSVFQFGLCHRSPTAYKRRSNKSAILTSTSLAQELGHIQHHLEDVVGQLDVNQMAEDELRFLYFKMHDSDDNNKLDGCELVNSLLHWHVEEHKHLSPDSSLDGKTKIFSNDELAMFIDPILLTDDRNFDGFIDYPEFVAAQDSRVF